MTAPRLSRTELVWLRRLQSRAVVFTAERWPALERLIGRGLAQDRGNGFYCCTLESVAW